jgi:ribosomal protein L21E
VEEGANRGTIEGRRCRVSVLASKPKHNIGDIVDFNLELTYKDCNGREGKIYQGATGEVVGMFCDVQCVTNGMNNWRYYIICSGMTHLRCEHQTSPKMNV